MTNYMSLLGSNVAKFQYEKIHESQNMDTTIFNTILIVARIYENFRLQSEIATID